MVYPGLQYIAGGTLTKNQPIRRKGLDGPLTYSKEIEDDLITWVLKQRDLQVPVNRCNIQHIATALVKPNNPLLNWRR